MALNFNGTSQSLTIVDSAPLDLGDVGSFAMWLRRTRTGQVEHLFAKGTGPMVLLFQSDNLLAIYRGGLPIIVTATLAIADTNWHHVVAAKNGATSTKIYIDGVDRTGTVTDSTLSSNATQLRVAADEPGPATWFQGDLAEFAIWNTFLSASDVLRLAYRERPSQVSPGSLVGYWPLGGGLSTSEDYSGNNGTATHVNAPTVADHPVGDEHKPALTRVESFENRTLSANDFAGARDAGFYDFINNAAAITVETDDPLHSSTVACVRVNGDGALQTNLMQGVAGGSTLTLVFSLYFKVVNTPASEAFMITGATGVSAHNPGITLLNNGTIGTFLGSSGPAGPKVNDGQWHRLDARFLTSGTVHAIDWMVDGVTMTQDTSTALTNNNLVTDLVLGSTAASNDCDVKFKDVLMSVTPSAFPIGPHRILWLTPAADGTHNAGTNVIESNDGTDIGVASAFNLLDEWAADITSYVQQAATGAGNYAEVAFAQVPQGARVLGAEVVAALFSSGTTANNGTTRAVYHDGSSADVYGADMSETDLHYRRLVLDAAKANQVEEINALRMRLGFSSNVATLPRWSALGLQVAIVEPPYIPVQVVTSGLRS